MQVVRNNPERLPIDGETNTVYTKPACYCCGKQCHSAADCKFKTAKCHMCQKTGHLARVSLSRQGTNLTNSRKLEEPEAMVFTNYKKMTVAVVLKDACTSSAS